jgi:hypothetical protein
MGIHSDFIPIIYDNVYQDVVIVDLDNDKVNIPFNTPLLPQPEGAELLRDLVKPFY